MLCLVAIVSFSSCKKDNPVTPIDPVVSPPLNRSYEDYELDDMAAKAGYYITDTLWANGDISGFRLRKNFDFPFTYPAGSNQNLYLGDVMSGKYFKENSGALKAYTKYNTKPLSQVMGGAYEINSPRIKYDLKINSIADMDDVVKGYLTGAKPSLYGFSRYELYHFSNYNQLSLLFGESSDVRKMLNMNSAEDLTKVDNGLVYYNMKETIDLKFLPGNKSLFEDPFSLDEVKSDEAGYVSKVTYGKISMMTVDSKLLWREMRAIIVKVSAQQQLTDQENDAVKAANVYTFLKGYDTSAQTQLDNAKSTLEKIKAFLAITNAPKPSNGYTSGTFTYGDHGVPLSFEITSASSNDKFLKNFNYSKSIKF